MINTIIYNYNQLINKNNIPIMEDIKINKFDSLLENLYKQRNYDSLYESISQWKIKNRKFIALKKSVSILFKISFLFTSLYYLNSLNSLIYNQNIGRKQVFLHYRKFDIKYCLPSVLISTISTTIFASGIIFLYKTVTKDLNSIYHLYKTETLCPSTGKLYFKDLAQQLHRWETAHRSSELQKDLSSDQKVALNVLHIASENLEKRLVNPNFFHRGNGAFVSLRGIAVCREHLPLTLKRLKRSHLNERQQDELYVWLSNHMFNLKYSKKKQYRRKLNGFLLKLEKTNA